MDASIIICTYNRAKSLRDTLQALKAQKPVAGREWEAIVVDNNSKDDTQQVIAEFQREWPLLRYEFEGKQGLSHARNHGIAAALGDILLFTDDDVLPEPEWLETTLSGLKKFNADACGGYIAPIWEIPPPGWLTERFYGFLAIKIDTKQKVIMPSATSGETPFGANMAFRRAVFECFGVFDTQLGRMGNVLASGEDSELFDRILSSGCKVMYFPEARVHHRVEAFRVEKKYFRRWRFQTSKNAAQNHNIPGARRIFGIPLYLFRQTLRAFGNAVVARLLCPADEAFSKEMIVWHFFGTLQGLRLLNNRNKNNT